MSLKVVSDASLYALPAHVFLVLCRRYSPFQAFFISAFNQRMEDESYGAAIAASQVVYFLSKIIPFSFLNEEEVKAIAPQVTAVHHPKETLVFVQGESWVDGLYIVQKGAAERYFEQNQRKTLHSILAEGEMFGGTSMLVDDMLADRTLRTIEDTTFYKLPHQAFFDLCRRFEAFSEYFRRRLFPLSGTTSGQPGNTCLAATAALAAWQAKCPALNSCGVIPSP